MRSLWLLIPLLLCGACLEPPEDDDVPLSTFFGDPDVDPAMVQHVEDDPALASNVAQFASQVAYLKGWADGESIWYWNVDGPNATFIAPLYQIIGPDGQQIGRTIIDVIPGDTGYTPWWRVFTVYTTDKYDGERIWSREGIDAGIRAGILQEPAATDRVANCPVVLRETEIQVRQNPDEYANPSWVWYRNQRVDWVVFTDFLRLEPEKLQMPVYPVYVLQRIDEGAPLYEFVSGVDITGDQLLNDSNNIFASGLDGPRYSPLWYLAVVRVEEDYLSIDTSSSAVGLSAEDQFYDPVGMNVVSSQVVPPISRQKDVLVNCPIQRTKGSL